MSRGWLWLLAWTLRSAAIPTLVAVAKKSTEVVIMGRRLKSISPVSLRAEAGSAVEVKVELEALQKLIIMFIAIL